MKWKWLTLKQKHERKRNKLLGWHRIFPIFRYVRDHKTQTAYWLQPVWRRAIRFHSDSLDYHMCVSVAEWEYREGTWSAPHMTECPEGITPSIVPMQGGLPDATPVETQACGR